DEGGEVFVLGEPVEIPGRIDLGAQDGVDAVVGEGGEDAVVEDSGGMDDGGEGMRGRDGGQEGLERLGVGCIAKGSRDAGACGLELEQERLGAWGGEALARGEKQVADAVGLHQMTGEPSAEGSGSAGDEDSALRVKRTRCGVRARCKASEARVQELAVAKREL